MSPIALLLLCCGSVAAQSASSTLSAITSVPWQTGVVSPDGTCGGGTGYVCSPQIGACCSGAGKCGRGDTACGAGCQTIAGNCYASVASSSPAASATSPAPDSLSRDGLCGGIKAYTCSGSIFGDCCSQYGSCGSTDLYCGAGCNSAYGNCSSSRSVSTDGTCAKNGKTCTGSQWGDCCSQEGYCGKSSPYCDGGCQAGFGRCSEASGHISTDGFCGQNGKTCAESRFGACCSQSGFCGSDARYCSAGCQAKFGKCSSSSGAISTDGRCGSFNSKTCVGSEYGTCCSTGSYCGSTQGHCGQGCQKGFSSKCLTADVASNDGSCGSKVGLTCSGGVFHGDCCSSLGWCGADSAHCDTGW